MIEQNLIFESIYLKTKDGENLHLKRIHSGSFSKPVLMIHGSIENGKIFYTESGKGFAPFLARNGYNVYVADLRGRGQSSPTISRNTKHGLSEIIDVDIPLYINYIYQNCKEPITAVSHSWGGVLLLAFLAHYPASNIGKMIFFGTKRRISVVHFERFKMIEFGWNFLGRLLTFIYGYLPAKQTKLGADNESKKAYIQTSKWVYSKQWKHWQTGENISKKLQKVSLPPILSITGSNDSVLGHPKDAQILLHESNAINSEFKIIGKEYGFKDNYDHITILTNPNANEDHFMFVLSWLTKF